jgi:acetate kinase
VVLPEESRAAAGQIEEVADDGFGAAFDQALHELAEAGFAEGSVAAVGHRVVHGGHRHTAPEVVDDELLASIAELARLAPLHNPPAAEGIRRARAAFPGVPHIAVFDTAYFAALPEAAATYALDSSLMAAQDIRRYGMHGTSHEYVATEAAELLGRDLGDLRQIILHLGNGASAAAVRSGLPVDTSMGLTPLEGLVMGTRGGDVDPGILLHLQRHGGLGTEELDDLLHHRSGLRGLAGTSDFRELLIEMDRGDPSARLALDVYCHRARKYVGAYLAVLGGADVIVFTAGVGENLPRVREQVLTGMDRLGIEIDPARNTAPADSARVISTDASPTTVLVVPTDEELAIARRVAEVMDARQS